MIAPGRFKQDIRNIFQTKLIYTAALVANRYEIGRAVLFAWLLLIGRPIEVNRPDLIARDMSAATTYFGERVSACVFTSRLCLSTTLLHSRSTVFKPSFITMSRG